MTRRESAVRTALPEPAWATLRSLRVALFAETPVAAGLATLLTELGVEVRLIGVRDTSLGGEKEMRRALDDNGVTLDPRTVVWERPSIRRVRRELLPALLAGAFDIVIGTTTELSTLRREPGLRGLLSPVRLLEHGFPATHRHPTEATPTFGHAGVLAWAQRLLDESLAPRVTVTLPREASSAT